MGYQQIQALNGLRGLAAILVILCHLNIPEKIQNTFPHIINLKEFGWVGVPIYFVLSGYLITWLAQEEMQNTHYFSLRFFFLRRILRLWPIYILTCSLGLWAWSFPDLDAISSSPEWIWPLMTFTTNIAITLHWEHFGVLGAYWTLALEEQFYLVAGLSFKYLPAKKCMYLCLFVLVICLVWRLHPLPSNYFLHYRIQPPVSLASIALGCLFVWIYPKIADFIKKAKIPLNLALLFCVFSITYWEIPFPTTAEGSFLLITSADIVALLLLALALGNSGFIYQFFNLKPLIYIGKISLCIYATNLPIIFFYSKYPLSIKAFGLNPINHPYWSFIIDILLIYLIIILIASLWQLIDTPITRLRYLCRPHKLKNIQLKNIKTENPTVLIYQTPAKL